MTTIKSHDTAITFSDALTLGGVAYDLTGCTVKFVLRNRTNDGDGGVRAFSDAATVVSEPAGTVSYQPGAGFPTQIGKYRQEWEVTIVATGRTLSFPSDDYNDVKIIEDLNGA